MTDRLAAQRTVWVAYYLDYEQSYVSEERRPARHRHRSRRTVLRDRSEAPGAGLHGLRRRCMTTNTCTREWRTCPCEDCAVDRWIDEQDRKCTCCERVECVCPTDACYRCAMSEGVR